MKRNADWFAWVLQFVFGLIVGAFIGYSIASNKNRQGLLPDQTTSFTWGVALLFAGLASHYGDRLWLFSSQHIVPTDGVANNRTSLIVSILSAALGLALIVVAVLRNLQVI